MAFAAPTPEKATKERLRRLRFLRKHADPIAERLENCVKDQRCISGTCPVCGRALLRFFVSEADKLLKAKSLGLTGIVAVSIAFSGCPAGQLEQLSIKSLQNSVKPCSHAPERLREEITADYNNMIYAVTRNAIEARRRAFIRKWRLKHRAVADTLEKAGERLFSFTRLPPSQWGSARTTNAVERLLEEFKRRITDCRVSAFNIVEAFGS